MSLELLQQGERLVEIVHRHWFYLFKEIFVFAFLAFLPAAVFLAGAAFDVFSYFAVPGSIALLFGGSMCAWILFVLPLIMIVWTDYHLDMLVITNLRIVAIEQKGLFSREVSSFRYERIQDITIEVHGIIATVLDFGVIHIQTAGDNRDFLVTHIPHPQRVKDRAFAEYNRTFSHLRDPV
jgi:uncharacterized membrane protein YdbT with pleckstrin-like domain